MLIRTRHNKDKPYVQINTSALRNPNLSLKAKGLFSVLMANADDWEIHVADLCKRLKEGRDAIYSALKELIEQGYCVRTQRRYKDPQTGKWKFEGVEYVLYEENSKEFKESLPLTGFPLTDFPYTEKPDALSNIKESSKDDSKKKQTRPKKKQQKTESTPEAYDLCVFLLNHLKKKNPKFKEPNRKAWTQQIQAIMREDNRTVEELMAVIAWTMSQSDDFWPSAITSPTSLRKLFDKAWLRMNHKSKKQKEKDAEIERLKKAKENQAWAKRLIRDTFFPDRDDYIRLSDSCVQVKEGRGWATIEYLDPNFKEIIKHKLRSWGV